MRKNKLFIVLFAILVIYLLFGCDRRVAPEETIIVDYARLTASRHSVNIYGDSEGSSQGGTPGEVTLVVEVKDESSVGIPGVEVIFIKDSEKGMMTLDDNITNNYGLITANLKWFGDLGPDQRDTIEIRARVAGYAETLVDTIVFYSTLPGIPVHMIHFDDLSEEDTYIPLDTTDFPIRVRAISELEDPIPNLKIKFAASSGEIYPIAYTDTDGWAETKYSPETTGSIKISAAVDQETGSSDSISIFQYFTVPSGDPTLLEFQGGASINLQITGTGGNADAPVLVDVLDASGTLVENYPFELKVKFEITNYADMGGAYFGNTVGPFTYANVVNGTAATTVHSGTKSGTIGTVVSLYYVDPDTEELLPYPAADNVVNSSTNTITVSNGPPAHIEVQIEEEGDQQDGQWRCFVSASVMDINGNAVPDSTAVLFSTSNPSAAVTAFAYTFNENDNNNQNHGIAYTKLFYDSQHINDTVTIIAKAINNFGEQIVGSLLVTLPIQQPNIAVLSSREVMAFYAPMDDQGMPDVDFDEFLYAKLDVTLIDGFENAVNGTSIHFNVTQGHGKFNEGPFVGTTFPQWDAFEDQPDDVTGTDGPGKCSKYISVRLGDVILQPNQPNWQGQNLVAIEISSPDFEGNEAQVQIQTLILPIGGAE